MSEIAEVIESALEFLGFIVRTALEYKLIVGPGLALLFTAGFLSFVNRKWAVLGGIAMAGITFFGLLIMGK